jgi:hypothetical protein
MLNSSFETLFPDSLRATLTCAPTHAGSFAHIGVWRTIRRLSSAVE